MLFVYLFPEKIVVGIVEDLLFAGNGSNVEEVKVSVEVSVPHNQEGNCSQANVVVHEIPQISETRENFITRLSGISCYSHFQCCTFNLVDEIWKSPCSLCSKYSKIVLRAVFRVYVALLTTDFFLLSVLQQVIDLIVLAQVTVIEKGLISYLSNQIKRYLLWNKLNHYWRIMLVRTDMLMLGIRKCNLF